MADSITQKFGIDVSQALEALRELDGAYKTHLKTLNDVAEIMRVGGKKIQGDVKELATETNKSMGQATKSVERFHTSLALLSRIAFTQVAIKTLRILEQSTAQAARNFVDFEKGLSEIQALDPTTNLQDLAKSSQQLSNSFNVKLMDVVKARLDLVGSGFEKASDQAKLFSASAGLAKLGSSTQAEATDLLISSLNAYGQSAQQADKFARIFFAGADKGRFTISELAHNFGKAAPAARSLGVSVEELTSLFSTLTVKGVGPAEASTQANAIATAFIKPSDDMADALAKLGVRSGQTLIAQKGLAGAIKAVISTTNGSTQAIGTLFRNVRALRPVLTLVSDNFKTFNDHLANTRTLSQQDFNLRLQERLGTDAERASAAINKLKNAITIGLGGGLVETTAALDRMSGKIDTLAIGTEKFFRVLSGHGLQDLKQSFIDASSEGVNKFEGSLVSVLNKEVEVGNEALDIAKKMGLSVAQVKKLSDSLNEAFSVEKINAFNKQNQAIFDDLAARSENRDINTALNEQFNAGLNALKALSQQSQVTDEELRGVLKVFQDVESQIGQQGFFAGLGEHAAFDASLEKVNRIFENILKKRQEAAKIPLADVNQAEEFAQRLQQASTQWPNDAELAAKQLLFGAEAISQALAKAGQIGLQAGAKAGVLSTGGVAHFAGGGFAPRGTDTIPAMLTPGEFVVNAKSTRRFFSQLQAINAGVAPIFRSEGGSVTNNNVSIGDIVVQGGSTSRQTARSIANELRRELRRGTSRL